jgi:Kdo2-lipid IVA lauroyltransferase/acyltransferase
LLSDGAIRKGGRVSYIGHLLSYWVVRALLCIAGAVSPDLCERAIRPLAWFMFSVVRFRRGIVLDNLRHAFPDLSDGRRRELGLAMWRHLLLFAAESAQVPRKIQLTNWRRYLRLDRVEEFSRLILSGRPLVMVTSHFGNFEMAAQVLGMFGYTTHAVARPLDNPFLDDYIQRTRARSGIRILSKTGDHGRISDILRSGGIVSFVADQYAGTKGCWVEFFGRPASAHKAVALFALDADAILLAGYCLRAGRPLHYEMSVEGVLDSRAASVHTEGIRELTQWFTSRLEASIRRAPEQYWWVHRRWKDNREIYRQWRRAA